MNYTRQPYKYSDFCGKYNLLQEGLYACYAHKSYTQDNSNHYTLNSTAADAMQNYVHDYQYDELGNILSDAWKSYQYATANNYLLGNDNVANQFTYDEHGNTTGMPHLSIHWSYKDELLNAGNSTFTSYYNYDAQGNRTRKIVEKGNVVETRYYIGGYEVFRKEVNGSLDFERTTLNISDDEKVFLKVEQKDNEDKVVRYQYDNHLGSACLELDILGQVIVYEEYHPFGTTSYRSGKNETEVSLKRYKYCGKERDEETGLYYYGMRYYAAWLCRFISVDPLQFKYPHYTPYQYAGNKPITFIDLDGGEEKKVEKKIEKIKPQTNMSFPEPDPMGGLGTALNQIKEINQIDGSHLDTLQKLKPLNIQLKIEEKLTTNNSFLEFLPKLQEFEGGFVNHKNDKGGATNKGITLKTFTLYSKELFGLEPSVENLKKLTNEQAAVIYEKKYWDPSKAGNIVDKQIAHLYFDTVVNGGGSNILKTTIEQYGEVYDKSLSKNIETLNKIISTKGGEAVFNAFKENRIKRYEKLVEKDATQKVFLQGWKNRVNKFNYEKQD